MNKSISESKYCRLEDSFKLLFADDVFLELFATRGDQHLLTVGGTRAAGPGE